MLHYLAQQVRYPSLAHINKIAGRVIMQVTLDETGQISAIKAVHSDSPVLEKETTRVLRQMPAWAPAQNNGVPVSSTYLFPFHFQLRDTAANAETLPGINMVELSKKIWTDAPLQPLFISEEVTVTSLGVAR